MWRQLEFDFTAKPEKKKRQEIDYEALADYIRERGTVTFAEIKAAAGDVSAGRCVMIIDTLSLLYPLWQPARGVYSML